MPRVYGRTPPCWNFEARSLLTRFRPHLGMRTVCPFPESVVEYSVVRSGKRGTLSANGLRFTSPTDDTLVIRGLYLDMLSRDNASPLRDGEGWSDK